MLRACPALRLRRPVVAPGNVLLLLQRRCEELAQPRGLLLGCQSCSGTRIHGFGGTSCPRGTRHHWALRRVGGAMLGSGSGGVGGVGGGVRGGNLSLVLRPPARDGAGRPPSCSPSGRNGKGRRLCRGLVGSAGGRADGCRGCRGDHDGRFCNGLPPGCRKRRRPQPGRVPPHRLDAERRNLCSRRGGGRPGEVPQSLPRRAVVEIGAEQLADRRRPPLADRRR
mmetsp:Transcript_6002/g.25185  ORF Transcript_6002/g.25185 Transcript_6002/m.25185 type:complete len:224 (-) Transcript_6002:44-715(-)